MEAQKLPRPAHHDDRGRAKKLIRWDSANAANVGAWRKLARQPGGDDWATDRLLSRPDFSAQAAPYWDAFNDLARDRPMHSISLGMAGGIDMPRPIPRVAIRREGIHLGYRGDDLADFCLIVRVVDDCFVEVETKRIADDVKRRAAQAKKR